jgi:4-amino-4-deoxy-L-arabinose transferase-like glycosyltransferase
VATLGLVFGAALLTKGPVGLLTPLGVVALACWLARRDLERATGLLLHVAAAAVVGVAIFAAWEVPAVMATSGRMVAIGLVRENVGRALAPMDGHGASLAVSLLYYPLVILVGFAPWTLYLPGALPPIVRPSAWSSRTNALIVAWIAVPLIAFTAAATKLPHYVLPIWPALALVVAATIAGANERRGCRSRAFTIGEWMIVTLIVAEATSLIVAGRTVAIAGLGRIAPATAALLLVSFAPALYAQRRMRPVVAAWSWMGGTSLMAVWVGLVVAPVIDRAKIVPEVAGAVRRAAPADTPIFAYQFMEPSLVFYSGRRVVPLDSDVDLARWSREGGRSVLVAPRDAISAFEQKHGSLRLEEIGAKKGWNFPKGRQVDLVAYLRTAGS